MFLCGYCFGRKEATYFAPVKVGHSITSVKQSVTILTENFDIKENTLETLSELLMDDKYFIYCEVL